MTERTDAKLAADTNRGGLVGKAAGEKIDPTVEGEYWAKSYSSSPYFQEGTDYKTYEKAYRYGWESFPKNQGKKFDDVEPELSRHWDEYSTDSSMTWDKAKHATRDAWHRVERAIPGDADNDGR